MYWRPGGSTGAAAVQPVNYIVPPVDAVMRIVVQEPSAAISVDAATLSFEMLIGASDVAIQISAQQMVGMARLADDAAIWARRNKYGRFRPSGWRTCVEAQPSSGWQPDHAASGKKTDADTAGRPGKRARQDSTSAASSQANAADEWMLKSSRQQRSGAQLSHGGLESQDTTADRQQASHSLTDVPQKITTFAGAVESAVRSARAMGCGRLVPTARVGEGAPVTWRQVWQYAINAVLTDIRDSRDSSSVKEASKGEVEQRR